jgi:hypothetical protein
VLLNQLDDFGGLSKDRYILVGFEFKLHLVPRFNDILKLVLDLVFFLGSLNQFFNVHFVLLEFEGD